MGWNARVRALLGRAAFLDGEVQVEVMGTDGLGDSTYAAG